MYYFTLFNIPPLYLHGHTPCITLLCSIYLHYTSMVTPMYYFTLFNITPLYLHGFTPMYYFTLFNIPPLYLHGHTHVLLYSVQYTSIIPPRSHPCITLLCSIYLHYTSTVTPMYYFTLFNIPPLYLHWSHPCITLLCSI